MSYDLSFWKFRAGTSGNHRAVYDQLVEGQRVEALEELPIDRIRAEIAEAFTEGWTQLDPDTWEGSKGTFQVFTTRQYVRIDCYGMDGEDMNRFIDILDHYGCPLYDPQTEQRYDGGS